MLGDMQQRVIAKAMGRMKNQVLTIMDQSPGIDIERLMAATANSFTDTMRKEFPSMSEIEIACLLGDLVGLIATELKQREALAFAVPAGSA